jgi:hypothetical protein
LAIVHVDESTPGLPNSGRLSGTNGDLVGILDVALPLNGWAIEYTTGNARIYRPGTGNRFRLYVNDDSTASGDARFALVRGCENASAASNAGLVDPFPLSSQIADASCNWHKSTAASTAARVFDIWVGETFVILAVNINGVANTWDLNFFGDYAPSLSGHTYNTMVSLRNSSNATTTTVNFAQWGGPSYSALTSPLRLFGARDYTGTVKSTVLAVAPIGNNSSIGTITGLPVAGAGVTTGIDTLKMSLVDYGASSGSPDTTKMQLIAGWMPNLLYPTHSGRGAINTRDEYTNTSAGMATGKVVTNGTAASAAIIVVQESGDWAPPNG